jgi:hypothetical protein
MEYQNGLISDLRVHVVFPQTRLPPAYPTEGGWRIETFLNGKQLLLAVIIKVKMPKFGRQPQCHFT